MSRILRFRITQIVGDRSAIEHRCQPALLQQDYSIVESKRRAEAANLFDSSERVVALPRRYGMSPA